MSFTWKVIVVHSLALTFKKKTWMVLSREGICPTVPWCSPWRRWFLSKRFEYELPSRPIPYLNSGLRLAPFVLKLHRNSLGGVSKVILKCIQFGLFRSLIGLWKLCYALSQSDGKLQPTMTLLLAFSRAVGSFPCVYFELSLTSRAISLVPLLIERLCSLRENSNKSRLNERAEQRPLTDTTMLFLV